MAAPPLRVLGVRHHGPGSARAVLAELDRVRPDVVLVEGPADADPLLTLAASPDLVPPVAILGYAVDDPARAVFWPMAVFSPEWQAIVWAAANGAAVRFCDLPTGQVLARGSAPDSSDPGQSGERTDPVAQLAYAAGYDDPERWWDDVIESRPGAAGFDAIAEAMAELRGELSDWDARREAHMRQVVRAVQKAQPEARVVLVCGAWHVPALVEPFPAASHDARLLKGVAKVRAALAWVPWTHSRLASASGYGAGVQSPGWYHHLFTVADRPVERWLIAVANLLRSKAIDTSPGHVIESVRLTETLAVMRNRPLAGLAEVSAAIEAVMCDGNPVLMDLVWSDLVVGEQLGSTPPEAPTVPLEADLRRSARSARLTLDPADTALVLDLRKPIDLAKSQLLHRMRVLGVPWGAPAVASGTGTFKEGWALSWRPEYIVDVVLASVWGGTVVEAATAALVAHAVEAQQLVEITDAVEQALLAGLDAALAPVLAALADAAAVDRDVEHLMAALPALARALRYGDVRGTDTASLTAVAETLLVRIRTGLPAAVGGLNDDAAAAMRSLVDAVTEVAALLPGQARQDWLATVHRLADREDINGVLAGRLVRLLLDAGVLESGHAALRLHRALSVGATVTDKAAWLDGFLSGGEVLLVHDRELLGIVDDWLGALPEDEFVALLPLLRRTFAAFGAAARRNIGASVATLEANRDPALAAAGPSIGTPLDRERCAPAVATVARILALVVPQ